MSEQVVGLCMIARRSSKKPGRPIVWDSIVRTNPSDEELQRQTEARVLCLMCPLLEACESYLAEAEQHGDEIEGVIAGRFCDCAPKTRPLREVQFSCRACGELMRPQREVYARPHPGKGARRKHIGEGLCDVCYPVLSRHAVAVA